MTGRLRPTVRIAQQLDPGRCYYADPSLTIHHHHSSRSWPAQILLSTELSSNSIYCTQPGRVGRGQMPRVVLDEGELRVVETLARTALVIIGLGLLCWSAGKYILVYKQTSLPCVFLLSYMTIKPKSLFKSSLKRSGGLLK